ncbi:hypothetical protein GCM10009422_23300 [Brevundimonas kwangchunensis]|uniref:Uncharacterized protein n=1 Tax=Brevundimonas kwangchunensis TaxID=322163 RepID=A0ABN1H108_9CAUL
MTFFPDFLDPQPLPDGRQWTAAFDSHDPREDDLYYVVRLRTDGAPGAPFIVRVWLGPQPDFSAPGLRDALTVELAAVAATGATNTAYTGRMV